MLKYLTPLWLLFAGPVTAQQAAKPVIMQGNSAAEKLHIHFDKDIYLPGETVWFKAYLYYDGKPSYLSTNFYLAVYDDEGRLLQQKQYPVFDGTCTGDYPLPDTLPSQTLRLRAFTKGLQLFDSTRYYERTLRVYQKTQAKPLLQQAEKSSTLRFYTEGGNAVAGFQNTIAVQAFFSNGTPAGIGGAIIDESNGAVIDSFYTGEEGLTQLQLFPEPGKNYTAAWKDENGIAQKLPVITNAAPGVLLHAEKTNNWLYWNILKNSDDAKYNTLQLTAKQAGDTVYSVTAVMNSSTQWIYKIPADSLPEGIINFELTGADNTVLQQRSILNTAPAAVKEPAVTILKKSLNAKGENELELEITDSLFHNMSVSITDAGFKSSENHSTINGDLWFTGYTIKHNNFAAKYLQTKAEKLQDLLLVAESNSFSKAAANKPQKPQDNFLYLNVQYRYKNHALPAGNNLLLVTADTIQGKKIYTLPPSGQTSFIKEGLLFYDSAQISYRLDKEKEESEYLTIQDYNRFTAPSQISKQVFEQPDTAKTALPINADSTFSFLATRKTNKFNEVQTIKEVVVKSRYVNPDTKRLLELEDKYASGMFKGIARGYQLNVLDDKKAMMYPDIHSYIRYRIPGIPVCITRLGENFLGKVPCRPEDRVITFVNETELMEQEGLTQIQMSQIAYIKFIPGIVIGSSFTTSSGALYIYLKKGDEQGADQASYMRKTKIKGYDIPKDFISPDYADRKSLLNADFRTTLYWNPYIATDRSNNKVRIIFNNNDVSKKLLLTIEGFNEEGRLIHIEKIIE